MEYNLDTAGYTITMKSFLREAIITVLLALVIYLIARVTIQTSVVFQTSMLPNLHEGQRVVVNKAAYWGWFGEPERGDVVIVKPPDNSSGDYVKRIIGLPGDRVEIIRGTVYINGVALDEPYVENSFTYSLASQIIPEDKYFVLGDNRDISVDSRYGWLPSREDIVGKAWLITWPPSDWGVVHDYPLADQLAAADTQTVS